MKFVTNLSQTPNAFIRKATQVLKKEGQEIITELPSGTTVKYIRGQDINAHGFGQKYKLYKEVTKPDNTRYVTNMNVIRDEAFVNEIYYIKANDRLPDYVQYADTYYFIPAPGFSNEYVIKELLTRQRPEILKGLLRKKLPPKQPSNPNWREEYRKTHTGKTKTSNSGQSSQGSKTTGSEQTYERTKTYNSNQSSQNSNTYGSGQSYQSSRGSDYRQSSQSSSTTDGSATSGKKITKTQFVDFMSKKFAHLGTKEFVDPKTLKDAEIRNLAKLFGVDETAIRGLDRSTKRKLLVKYHPDRNPNDNLANEIFQIVNKLKAA